MNNEKQAKSANWTSLILGAWLIISPFVLGFSGTSLSRNNIIFGIIVALISLYGLTMQSESSWPAWLNTLFGVWVFISPFIFGYVGAIALWNGLIVGIMVAVAGILAATSSSSSSAGHPSAV